MIRKLKKDAEKFLSESGYGTGTNFTTTDVSALMARFTTKIVNDRFSLPNCTRVEIIDENGRAYTNNDCENVEIYIQDNNETLKVSLT